ncbi:hypothetical protein C2G38_2091863 [Gigaspora rosea]|uniref:Uncharacterized protein n=1 Tax=Gigaspora rosea TaxID=44941 RepID=A0A397V0S0_9GLOM|nr:hypothetical protein C2G38_2091863 [Gigaspora rosea]
MEFKFSTFGIFLMACSMILAFPIINQYPECGSVCIGRCDTCLFIASNCTDAPFCSSLNFISGICGSKCSLHCGSCKYVCTGCSGTPPRCRECTRI